MHILIEETMNVHLTNLYRAALMSYRLPSCILICLSKYCSHLHVTYSQLTHSYKLLNVNSACSDDELREAYIHLAKLYHPDTNNDNADSKKFAEVEDAYRQIVAQRRLNKPTDNEDQTYFDIQHTAPQHRQYLEYGGAGHGTPSQRQHQHEQKRAVTAVENIADYQTQKLMTQHENAITLKDKKAIKKQTIRGAIDRLVEDLIVESMSKGDFDNLPGRGKPLQYANHNPFVDSMTHNINKILINNGYAPPWVTLEKEIRQDMEKACEALRAAYIARRQWQRSQVEFREAIDAINKKINRLNMIVPTVIQQRVHYNADRETERVIKETLKQTDECSRPLEDNDIQLTDNQPSVNTDRTTLRDVLKELKALFQH